MCLLTGAQAEDRTASGQTPIEITADGTNTYQDGIAYAEGNVIVRYGLDTIYADQVSFDQARREVMARGNVRIYAENKTYRGEFLSYNLESGQVESEDFRTASEIMMAYGDKVESPREDYYIITDGGMTFENRENPSYRVHAGTLEIYPNDLAVFRNVRIHIGPVPVMWLPYMAVPLDGDLDGLDFSVGSSSRLGVFGRGSYTTALNQSWDIRLHAGYFSRRGFGGGIDLILAPRPGDYAEFKSFWIQDDDPFAGLGAASRFDRPVRPNESRYRFSYRTHSKLADDIYARADINIWSDRHVTEDFFRDEFREEREPDNFVEAVYYDPNFTVSFLTRIQMNGLFSPPEQKPGVSLEFKRQSFLNTFLSYESESSIVNFSQDFDRDVDTTFGVAQPITYDSARYDTFHQLLYPNQYFDWLNFTPFVGGRATYYSRTNNPTPAPGNPPNDGITRLAVNGGFDMSFKLSKTWADYKAPGWGIDGLRHVFEPYLTASYVLPNETPTDFRGYDYRLPNTRLAPITFPGFNSIDSINELGAVRHGIRQSLQTKRDGRNYNILDWKLYTQANIIRPDDGMSLNGTPALGAMPSYLDMGLLSDDLYSHIFNELEFRPFPWLRYEVYAAAPLASNTFTELTHSLLWQVHPAIELRLSHQYIDDLRIGGVSFTESQRVTASSYWRLNENWQFEPGVSYEGDDGVIDQASMTIYRDLQAWKAGLTAAYRDNRINGDEYLVYLTLTLKAFPQMNISIDN
jgi:LPS-assembly protein